MLKERLRLDFLVFSEVGKRRIMENSKRIATVTLGCKVNAYDTQAMLEIFVKNGYSVVDFSEEADVYLINTCTVTNLGDKKSRQMIRRAKKQNLNSIVIAAGCYAQVKPDEVAAIEGVDLIVGTAERGNVFELVEAYQKGFIRTKTVGDVSNVKEFEKLKIESLKGHTRAYVKIQEGCDSFCSYCIVPYARGRARSRALTDCVLECKRLAENGFKEIVLSGIHVASYGKDLVGESLTDVIAAVQAIDGIERIRLSSLEPSVITDAFLDRVKESDKICDHFHLSLQSGCDKTLRGMNRKYDTNVYEAAVSKIRNYYPDVGLTTDIIVGFPGETQQDFEESMRFCEKMEFSKIHVFPFSAKEGTRAYGMDGQISLREKKERTDEFIKLSEKQRDKFLDANTGRRVSVLFERMTGGMLWGYTTNYIQVRSQGEGIGENSIHNVILSKDCIE